VIQYGPWDPETPEQFHGCPEFNITGKLTARGKEFQGMLLKGVFASLVITTSIDVIGLRILTHDILLQLISQLVHIFDRCKIFVRIVHKIRKQKWASS
jgi:hypothetical protein